MSFWKGTMEWLGLGPDDAYDDYEYEDDYAEPEPRRARRQSEPEPRRPREEGGNEGVVRTMPNRPTFPSRDFDPSQARRDRDDSSVQPRPQRSGVSRPTPSGEPAAIAPRRFDQAQELADKYKEGLPVIMNLEGAEREVARRLIDFASGLCYGLDGSMEKVANGVYLLKPASASTRRGGDDYDG